MPGCSDAQRRSCSASASSGVLVGLNVAASTSEAVGLPLARSSASMRFWRLDQSSARAPQLLTGWPLLLTQPCDSKKAQKASGSPLRQLAPKYPRASSSDGGSNSGGAAGASPPSQASSVQSSSVQDRLG